jgi:hypothetical protein
MRQRHADHYIYLLFRENGAPFYVGKGRGKRESGHEGEARNGHTATRHDIVRDMMARGLEIPKVRLHEDLTNSVANVYERALIAAIGRADKGLGPLANLTDGGDGTSGHRRTREAIAKTAAARRGMKHTPEALSKMRAASLGKAWLPASRAKVSAALKGRPKSAEHVAKLKAANLGKRHSLETRAKIGDGHRGRKQTPEHIANAARTRVGRKMPPDAVAKSAAARQGKKRSFETVAKMRLAALRPDVIARKRAANLGRKHLPATIEKMRDANLGKKHSPEHKAKIGAGIIAYHQRRRAAEAQVAQLALPLVVSLD